MNYRKLKKKFKWVRKRGKRSALPLIGNGTSMRRDNAQRDEGGGTRPIAILQRNWVTIILFTRYVQILNDVI